jgi:hypothetical protein
MNICRRAWFLIIVSALYLIGCVVAWAMDCLNVYVNPAQVVYVAVLSVPMWSTRVGRMLHMKV